jgi:hypothetical protein
VTKGVAQVLVAKLTHAPPPATHAPVSISVYWLNQFSVQRGEPAGGLVFIDARGHERFSLHYNRLYYRLNINDTVPLRFSFFTKLSHLYCYE